MQFERRKIQKRYHAIIEAKPYTCRTPKIHVHLAAVGHPILGDLLYGDRESAQRASSMSLRACHLSIAHPMTHEILCFDFPDPDEFETALQNGVL